MWNLCLRQELKIFHIKLLHGIGIWEHYFSQQFGTMHFMNTFMLFLRSHLISRCHLCSVLRDFLILLVVVSYQKEAFSTGWCRLFPEHPLCVNLIKDLIVTAFLVWNKFLELSSYNKQNKIVFFHKLNFLKKTLFWVMF